MRKRSNASVLGRVQHAGYSSVVEHQTLHLWNSGSIPDSLLLFLAKYGIVRLKTLLDLRIWLAVGRPKWDRPLCE